MLRMFAGGGYEGLTRLGSVDGREVIGGFHDAGIADKIRIGRWRGDNGADMIGACGIKWYCEMKRRNWLKRETKQSGSCLRCTL